MNENPLTDLVATNVLNLIAIHGNIKDAKDLDKIKLETPLNEIGINDSKKKEIFDQFEKALGVVYVGDDKYNFIIKKNLSEIINVSDMIKAVLDTMQDIVKQVSE